jgi:predicted nucleotide-binding protein
MQFHVYVFERFDAARGRGRTGQGYYFKNLTGDQLRERIVGPWDRGLPMTWDGRTADSRRTANIRVFETEEPIPPGVESSDAYRLMEEGADVTNDWITGPAGFAAAEVTQAPDAPQRDTGRVMVVHGRNGAARAAMFTFLRAIGLSPIEWEDAVATTGVGSPHNLAAVRAAMDIAQGVVVILTAEDRAGLLPDFASAESPEVRLEGQPRQNVTLEAGMAMGIDPDRTILVQLGQIRGASDFDGLNHVRLTNAPESRRALSRRLATAGCAVNEAGADWLSPTAGGDFEGSVVAQQASAVAELDGVMAIPTTDMRGSRVELNVRCFRLPADVRILCVVTAPDHDPLEEEVPGQEVGPDQTLHSTVYPDAFVGSPRVAGTHLVRWVAVATDGERRELVTADFRIP